MPVNKVKGSKDGKQKYRVRINYVDTYGNYKQIERTEYGLAEAKELELQLLTQAKKAPERKMTVQSLFDEYIKVKSRETRQTTTDKTKRVYEQHIAPYLSNCKLDKLIVPVLQDWKNKIEETEYSHHGRNGKLKLKTKQNIYGEFRALLYYAVKMDYLSQNPLLKVGNFKDTSTIKEEMQYYTPEEFEKFITAARHAVENSPTIGEWDYYVFFCIAFYTGLRKGEIHALKWSDINGEYLSVSRSISQKLKGRDIETPPKNKSSIRTIQIPQPLIKVLDEHKRRYKKLKGFNDNYRVTGGTAPLRDTSIENANRRYAAAAGIKKIRIHDFRHSHASVLCNSGINIQEVARRLGHANIEMTWNTYAHLYPKEEERATEILNKIKA